MKLHDQIIFSAGKGDCLRACIAVMIGAENIETLPNFCHAWGEDDWWGETQKWCVLQGYLVENYSYPAGWKPCGEQLWIACGPAERGLEHAVIMAGTKLFHDPHPSRKGLIEIKEAIIVMDIKYELDYYHKCKCKEQCPSNDKPTDSNENMANHLFGMGIG